MIEIKGKNVIVTGAGNGIGRAIALSCADAGANIVVADIAMENAEKVAGEVKDKGVDSLAVQVDVTKEDSTKALVAEAVEKFGTIDVMVNNAGICTIADVETMSLEEWQRTIDIDLTGVFLCCKAIIPQMKKQGYGKIINAASQAGKVGMENLSHYCAAKAGVILLTRSLALELAPYNITANSVCPGNVDTGMMEREAVAVNKRTGQPIEEIIQGWTDCIPMGRYAQPEEVSDIYLFLASKYSDYMTGEDVNVTGGMTMH